MDTQIIQQNNREGKAADRMAHPVISVVIPTYNERENIIRLIPQLVEAFQGAPYEILVVDDNSPDGTGDAVQECARTNPRIRLITKHKKEGIGAALRVGYDQAQGDIIVSSDADLSFRVNDLVRLTDAVSQGADLALGSRHAQGAAYEAEVFRVRCKRWVSRLGNVALRGVFRIPVHDFSANCRAIRRSVWQQIHTQEKTNTLLLEMILRCHYGGFRVSELPVTFQDRQYGVSKLRLSIEAPKFLLKMAKYRWYYLVHRTPARGRRVTWGRLIPWLAVAALWLYTLAHFVHGSFQYRGYGDLFVLLAAVREWLSTGQFPATNAYLYPPFFNLVNIPLAMLSDQTAARIMVALNQVLLVVAFGLIAAATSTRLNQRVWLWVLLPLALNFRPLLLLLSMAKIEMVQVTLLLGMLLACQRRRPGLAGALMALAGMLKPLPLVLVLYFIWKRDWKVVRAWAATVAIILAICSAFIGIQAVGTYFSSIALPRGSNTMYWYEDQSFMGFATRLFHRPQPSKFFLDPVEVSQASLILGWCLRLAVLGWLGFLTRLRQQAGESHLKGQWSMIMAGMLLISPLSRDYYAVFLLPAYLLFAQHLWAHRCPGNSLALWLGAFSYLLVGQGFPLGIIHHLPSVIGGVDNFHTYLHYGVPTLGYVLLIAAWARAEKEFVTPAAASL